ACAVLILVVLRDRPGRYGIRFGDVRAGIAIGLTGIVVMTPVVVALTLVPSFRDYYVAAAATPPLDVVLSSAIEVVPAEAFFRGLLMFTLLRAIGPFG